MALVSQTQFSKRSEEASVSISFVREYKGSAELLLRISAFNINDHIF